MHEFSVADALIDLIKQHLPPDATLRAVTIEAGPMRGIDREAMQFAWQSVTPGTCCENARLDLRILPWKMQCPTCGRQFESDQMYIDCACGDPSPYPQGGDDLRLLSLEVDVPDEANSRSL